MKYIHLAALVLGVAFVSSAGAQPSCPPGSSAPYCDRQLEPGDGLDHTLELPPLLGNDLQAPVPPVRQSEQPAPYRTAVPQGTPTWGAVAKDYSVPGVMGMGVSNNRLYQEDAAAAALVACEHNGGRECMVETTYSNRCLAIAINEKEVYQLHVDVTPDLAGRGAIQACAERGASACKVIYIGCSYPVP